MKKEKTRFFLDTEFIESGPNHPIYLLSIGLCTEASTETYYAEVMEAPRYLASEWVLNNVIKHLHQPTLEELKILHTGKIAKSPQDVIDYVNRIESKENRIRRFDLTPYRTLREIRGEVELYINRFLRKYNSIPEFWTYYGSHDWVLFEQLFGSFENFPREYPQFHMDLKQYQHLINEDLELSSLAELTNEHHALADAKWNMRVFHSLRAYTKDLFKNIIETEIREELQAKGYPINNAT